MRGVLMFVGAFASVIILAIGAYWFAVNTKFGSLKVKDESDDDEWRPNNDVGTPNETPKHKE